MEEAEQLHHHTVEKMSEARLDWKRIEEARERRETEISEFISEIKRTETIRLSKYRDEAVYATIPYLDFLYTVKDEVWIWYEFVNELLERDIYELIFQLLRFLYDERFRLHLLYDCILKREYKPILFLLENVGYRFFVLEDEEVIHFILYDEEAFREMDMDKLAYGTSLCTHEYCFSSRMFIRWIETREGVPIYIAFTYFKSDPVEPEPFPTADPNIQNLEEAETNLRKYSDEAITSVIALCDEIVDLIEQHVVYARRTDGTPVLGCPAVIGTQLSHRIIYERARIETGRIEEYDSYIHCSIYYMPRNRPLRTNPTIYQYKVRIGRYKIWTTRYWYLRNKNPLVGEENE